MAKSHVEDSKCGNCQWQCNNPTGFAPETSQPSRPPHTSRIWHPNRRSLDVVWFTPNPIAYLSVCKLTIYDLLQDEWYAVVLRSRQRYDTSESHIRYRSRPYLLDTFTSVYTTRPCGHLYMVRLIVRSAETPRGPYDDAASIILMSEQVIGYEYSRLKR